MPVDRSILIGSFPGDPPPSNLTAAVNDAAGIVDSATSVLVQGGGTITHGRDVNATNTGIAGAGLTRADLTAGPGTIVAGTTYTKRLFTGNINLAVSNVTFDRCQFEGSGTFGAGIDVTAGTGCLIVDCTIIPSPGAGYMGVWVEGGSGLTIRRCNISNAENIVSLNASGATTIEDSYLWGSHNAPGNVDGHKDTIEVYSGAGIIIRRCKIVHPSFTETSAINIAPWSGAANVNGLAVTDCFIDGGHMHFVIDLQSTGYIRNVSVLRCDMGGHTTPTVGGIYWAFNGNGAGFTSSAAAQAGNQNLTLCPSSGADANYWQGCTGLSPNRSGQLLDPNAPAIYQP